MGFSFRFALVGKAWQHAATPNRPGLQVVFAPEGLDIASFAVFARVGPLPRRVVPVFVAPPTGVDAVVVVDLVAFVLAPLLAAADVARFVKGCHRYNPP